MDHAETKKVWGMCVVLVWSSSLTVCKSALINEKREAVWERGVSARGEGEVVGVKEQRMNGETSSLQTSLETSLTEYLMFGSCRSRGVRGEWRHQRKRKTPILRATTAAPTAAFQTCAHNTHYNYSHYNHFSHLFICSHGQLAVTCSNGSGYIANTWMLSNSIACH